MRVALIAVAVALIATGCRNSAPTEPGLTNEAAAADRQARHRVFRPELRFSDGRTKRAGVAFLLDAGGGHVLVATSGHLARNLRKDANLVQFTLLDNASGTPMGTVVSLAGDPGATFDGLDYSTDIALLNSQGLSDPGEPFVLASDVARVGDEVEITACPADRSASDIQLRGLVEGSDGTLLRVRFQSPVDGRAFAGAPIASARSGELVGMVQTIAGGVALATPGVAIKRFAAGDRSIALPITDWR